MQGPEHFGMDQLNKKCDSQKLVLSSQRASNQTPGTQVVQVSVTGKVLNSSKYLNSLLLVLKRGLDSIIRLQFNLILISSSFNNETSLVSLILAFRIVQIMCSLSFSVHALKERQVIGNQYH